MLTCFLSDANLIADRVEYVPGGEDLECQVVVTGERQPIATYYNNIVIIIE